MSTNPSSSDTDGRFQVIISGAGPTGLVLANLLGQFGVSTLVVERNTTTVQEPRAVSIDDESLRTVQATGLLDQVIQQVVPGYGSRYLTPAGKCFLTVMPSGRPYGHPRRNAFRQPVFEQQMRQGLERYETVIPLFGWTVTDFSQDDHEVEVTIARNGEVRRVWAEFLVGADGASSFVRKRLDIALEGETLPERWLIVDLANSPAERNTVVFCDIARPCIALPGPDSTRRFEFKLFEGENEESLLMAESVDKLLQSRGAAPGSRIIRKTIYTFHARLAARWSEGRIFLAGDAAHLTPPFAGQGMNSGVRDAFNLAWKLASVVKRELPQTILSSYELERREHVEAMIDLALRMGRIMGPPSAAAGWLTQTAFRIAGIWPALRSYFAEMKYKPKPRLTRGLFIAGKHPLVGRLLPQPRIRGRDGSEMLLDDVLPEGFVLIGVGINALDSLALIVRRSGIALSPLALDTRTIQGECDESLTGSNGWALLVRPDRYVLAAFQPAQTEKTSIAIRTLLFPGIDGRETAPRSTELAFDLLTK
jgi:3-(3-hydroxy-phenyl)propionate hydroxylase